MSNITKLESKLQIVAKFWLKKHFGLETIKTSFAFKSDKRHYQIYEEPMMLTILVDSERKYLRWSRCCKV